jgi:hypothetical protein
VKRSGSPALIYDHVEIDVVEEVPPGDINAVLGYAACPSPAAVATCSVQIMFTRTTYSQIDFLPPLPVCPTGLGRYTWTLADEVLHFVPLNQDPCRPRTDFLANRSYFRTR